jgi:ABC-type iron transport system FetAB ATPase subunit
VTLLGEDFARLSETRRGDLRNASLGFVYQFHHLLPEFSALDNVAMPLLIRRVKREEAVAQAQAILARVGLAKRAIHRRASCRAANASAWRWRARWSRNRPACWPTSRPATSTTHRADHLRPDAGTVAHPRHGLRDRHPRPRTGAPLRPRAAPDRARAAAETLG